MKLLLDTHVAIWSLYGGHLAPPARDALRSETADLYVSIATVWEVAIKKALGRDPAFSVPDSFLDDLAAVQVALLPVTVDHAWRIRNLPALHGDPFDRMIVTQALAEAMTLVTRDSEMTKYPVQTIIA